MTNPNDIPAPVLDAQTDKVNDSAQETVSASTVAPSDMVQSLLSSKQYNILKWVVIIVLPAITTVYGTFSNIWGWPYGDQIVASFSAITLFLGIIIGVSTSSYNMSSAGPSGTLVVDRTDANTQTYLAFKQDPKTIADGSQITLNVRHVK